MDSVGPTQLVAQLGGRESGSLGIPLRAGDDTAIGRWFAAACLASASAPRARHAFRALDAAGLSAPGALVSADLASVSAALEAVSFPKPPAIALKLMRAAAALGKRYGASFTRLAGEAEGLEDLAGRVAQLAPGVGAATAMRFLRELREIWPLADELPLTPAARAAAVHLGLLHEGEDVEGPPGALRAALAALPRAPELVDVDAALHRLGSAACLRGRVRRCPLGAACPALS